MPDELGLKSLSDINEGDSIVKVPRNAIISYDSAYQCSYLKKVCYMMVSVILNVSCSYFLIDYNGRQQT